MSTRDYSQLGTTSSVNNTDLIALWPSGGPLVTITAALFRSTYFTGTYLPLAGGTMTGALLGYAGTESLPGFSFASDTDNGFYRIGANNIGYSAAGVKLLDLASGAVSVVGTLAVSGAVTASAALSVGTTLGVTGAATLSSTLAVTGASTFTGSITQAPGSGTDAFIIASATGAADGYIQVKRPAGRTGALQFTTVNSGRWLLGANSTAESGTNAGSNFVLNAYDDSAVLIGTALTVVRSSMAATFGGALTVTGATALSSTLAVTGAATFDGNVTLGNAAGDAITITGTPTVTPLITLNGGGNQTPATTPATNAIGYLGAPQNTQNAAYGIAMTDAGKMIYHTSGSTHTWTIPANASVAFPIGTVIMLVNENGGGNVTVAITSDTLRWGSSTGSRTLAANGTAAITKVASTTWRMTGDGIS